MKNLAIIGVLALVLSGCALQRQARTNAKSIQQLDRNQRKLTMYLKMLVKQKRQNLEHIVANNRRSKANKKRVDYMWKRLTRYPTLTLRETHYRQVVTQSLRSLSVKNKVVGEALYGDAYFVVVAETYLVSKKLKYAVAYYKAGIYVLEPKVKAKTARCGLLGKKLGGCEKLLALAYYNRACIYAQQGKKVLAKDDIEWLDKTGNMKYFITKDHQFWNDTDLRVFKNEEWFKKLVKFYKAVKAKTSVKPRPKPQTKRHRRKQRCPHHP